MYPSSLCRMFMHVTHSPVLPDTETHSMPVRIRPSLSCMISPLLEDMLPLVSGVPFLRYQPGREAVTCLRHACTYTYGNSLYAINIALFVQYSPGFRQTPDEPGDHRAIVSPANTRIHRLRLTHPHHLHRDVSTSVFHGEDTQNKVGETIMHWVPMHPPVPCHVMAGAVQPTCGPFPSPPSSCYLLHFSIAFRFIILILLYQQRRRPPHIPPPPYKCSVTSSHSYRSYPCCIAYHRARPSRAINEDPKKKKRKGYMEGACTVS